MDFFIPKNASMQEIEDQIDKGLDALEAADEAGEEADIAFYPYKEDQAESEVEKKTLRSHTEGENKTAVATREVDDKAKSARP
jgi:hypothetical protein